MTSNVKLEGVAGWSEHHSNINGPTQSSKPILNFILFIFILMKTQYKKKGLEIVCVIADYWSKPVYTLLPHCPL